MNGCRAEMKEWRKSDLERRTGRALSGVCYGLKIGGRWP